MTSAHLVYSLMRHISRWDKFCTRKKILKLYMCENIKFSFFFILIQIYQNYSLKQLSWNLKCSNSSLVGEMLFIDLSWSGFTTSLVHTLSTLSKRKDTESCIFKKIKRWTGAALFYFNTLKISTVFGGAIGTLKLKIKILRT